MITIPQPALALNSTEFPSESHYTMRHTHRVTRGTPVDAIVTLVAGALAASGGRLEAVIINAHGMFAPDGVALGTRLHLGNAHLWGRVAGAIRRIWLCACQVADTQAGQDFCQALSAATGSEMIGALEEQVARSGDREWAFDPNHLRFARIPPGQIDEFEGVVYAWTAGAGRLDFNPHS
ncbi:hypothetical protein [Roseomonas sp. HF4]|uniref:hypothetical protein n=1 Tax=Roseomonas sp. HF4 TaxID=2562313 RepID=UPI0010C0BB34|nr:hypothetical protein [Roseomonas sp. HF4]